MHTVKPMQADFLIQIRLFSLMDGFTMEQGGIKTKSTRQGEGLLMALERSTGLFLPAVASYMALAFSWL